MSLAEKLSIEPVSYASKGMDEFMRLPWSVQKGDPCWVPPIIDFQRQILNPAKGTFFEIGEVQYFLARRGGRPVGRLSAHINRMHDERYNDNTGFFGFFECANDPEAAAALLDAAANWLRERGRSRILGPLGFTIYEEIGVLVDGFDTLPAILQTHNPPYYQDLLLSWGLRKAVDWYALKVTSRKVDVSNMQKEMDDIMAKQGLVMTQAEPRTLIERLDEVRELFNEAWQDNWGHIPFTRSQMREIMENMKPLLRADLMRFMFDASGHIVGFIITIPDLNPVLQKFDGHIGIFDYVRLYYEAKLKPLRKLRTILLGVKREYQNRQLHHAMILSTYLQLLNHPKVYFCDLSLISEPLRLFIKSLEKYGAHKYKTWRIFEREI